MPQFHDRNLSFPEPPSHKPSRYHWAWAAALAVITLITIVFRYAIPVRDGDLWWHMAYGKYFLENRTIIADHTVFSWTPTSNETIYCSWLSDIFFYLVYQVSDLAGLFAFRYACILTLVLTCFLYARRLKLSTHPLVWLIALIAVLMSYTATFLKPEIISFTLMTLTVWCWFHIRSRDNKAVGWCYLIPLIMLIWVNSHGGFIFGAAFLLVAAIGELTNTWFSHGNMLTPRCRKHVFFALVLSFCSIFLTPYGYHYPLQLLARLIPNKENMAYNTKIAAYYAPFESFTPYQNFALYANLALGILIIFYIFNFMQKKVEWSSLLTNLLFAFLYTKFLRTTFYWAPVFALSSIYMLQPTRIHLNDKRIKQILNKYLPLPILTLAGALVLSTHALYVSYCRPQENTWMGFGIGYFNPYEEAEYIEHYFPTSRIGNTYTEGGYLLWKLWPKNKVFFDPRHFPYKSWSDEYFEAINGSDMYAFEKFINRYPSDLWCISLYFPVPLLYFTQSPQWQLAFYGNNSAIFVRSDIPLPEGIPKASADFGNVRNVLNAVRVLAFATTIQDWQVVNTLLKAIQDNFHCGDKEFLYQWSTILRDGMQAYWSHDYAKAVLQLQRLPAIFIDPGQYYLLNSYFFLMKEAWLKNDFRNALILATKVWNLYEKNTFAVYNLGVIGWYYSKQLDALPASQNTDSSRWRFHLQDFLKKTQGDVAFKDARIIARQLLNGDFPDGIKPSLIVIDSEH